MEYCVKKSVRVMILTLVATLTCSGCSYLHYHYGEQCKSHAYLKSSLADFIGTRFQTHSPVRMAVIPFSTEANVAAQSMDFPGLGDQLSWRVQAALLDQGDVPIVEVFNRQDWPGKKEEFFTGNFGAIAMAREAGYDLVLVGLIEPNRSLDSLSVYTKILDVESGITIWYGKTTGYSNHQKIHKLEDKFWITDREPSKLYLGELTEEVAECIVKSSTEDPQLVEESTLHSLFGNL